MPSKYTVAVFTSEFVPQARGGFRVPPLVAVFLAVASTGALVAEQAPELRQAAERGNADAQFDLGEAYYEGEGEEQDCVTAAAWWRRAAAHSA